MLLILALAALAHAAAPPKPVLEKHGSRYVHRYWGFEIKLPSAAEVQPGVIPSFPKQVFFGTDAEVAPTTHVNVSVIVEEFPREVTPMQCAVKYLVGSLDSRHAMRVTSESKPAPQWYFDEAPSAPELKQLGIRWDGIETPLMRQGYAYFTRGNTCFEIHMSNSRPPGKDAPRQLQEKMEAIVESFKLAPESLGDLALWSTAIRKGLDPTNPALFDLAGQSALYQAKDYGKAELYYRGALKLDPEPLLAWDAQEGLGLIQLERHQGEQARIFFTASLRTCRKNKLDRKYCRECLYNLVCAESLAKELKASARHLKELLDGLKPEPAELKKTIQKLEKDSDTENLRKAPGYQDWIKLYKGS